MQIHVFRGPDYNCGLNLAKNMIKFPISVPRLNTEPRILITLGSFLSASRSSADIPYQLFQEPCGREGDWPCPSSEAIPGVT